MNNVVGFIAIFPLVLLIHSFGEVGIAIWLVLVFGIFGLLFKWQKGREAEQLEVLAGCISDHIRELALKHRQLTFSGDYGVIDNKKWHREQKKFIDTIYAPRVGGLSQMMLKPERIRAIIDSEVHRANDGVRAAEALVLSDDASGTDYEYHCAELFKKCGWDARMVGGAGDNGADIVATRAGLKLVVQCKYYTGNVGNDAVQEAASGRTYHEADMAVVISNAGYTKAARQLAKSLDVRLMHHDDIPTIDGYGSSL